MDPNNPFGDVGKAFMFIAGAFMVAGFAMGLILGMILWQ